MWKEIAGMLDDGSGTLASIRGLVSTIDWRANRFGRVGFDV